MGDGGGCRGRGVLGFRGVRRDYEGGVGYGWGILEVIKYDGNLGMGFGRNFDMGLV